MNYGLIFLELLLIEGRDSTQSLLGVDIPIVRD